MQVKITELMRLMGVETTAEQTAYQCPLHVHAYATLTVQHNAAGVPVFRCQAPECGFYGDAITLLARKLNVTPATIFDRITSGDYRHIFPDSEDIAMYHAKRIQQAEVRLWLTHCQHELRDGKEGFSARHMAAAFGWMNADIHSLPTTIGMLSRKDLPQMLKFLATPKYRELRLVCPYTFDEHVTHITVRQLAKTIMPPTTFPIDELIPHGVFMEDTYDPEGRQLLLTTDEPTALILYRTHMLAATRTPTILTFKNFPLPNKFRAYERLTIVHTTTNPLSLVTALQLFNAEAQFYDATTTAELMILRNPAIDKQLDPLFATDWLAGGRATTCSLAKWLIDNLREYLRDDRQNELVQCFHAAHCTEATISRICAEAKSQGVYTGQMERLLRNVTTENRLVIPLANGNQIRRLPYAIHGLTMSSTPLLANFGLTIRNKIVTRNNKQLYNCDILTDSPGVPALNLLISVDCFKSSRAIQRKLSKEFAARNYAPYIAAYERHGYSWPDIAAKLGSNVPVTKEVLQLGTDDTLTINLPECAISLLTGNITTQNGIYTLSNKVQMHYRGIKHAVMTDYQRAWTYLLQPETHPAAAYAIGILHVLMRMAFASLTRKRDKYLPAQHLVYASAFPWTTAPILRALANMLSGSDHSPHTLHASDPLPALQALTALGELPLVTTLSKTTSPDKLIQAVEQSPIGIVTTLDSNMAGMLSGTANVNYVTLPAKEDYRHWAPDDQLVNALQQTFAQVILESHAAITSLLSVEAINSSTPLLTVYEAMCTWLAIKPSALITDNVHHYHAALDLASAESFLFLLGKLLVTRSPENQRLVCANGMYGLKELLNGNKRMDIIHMPGCMLVHKQHTAAIIRRTSQQGAILAVESIDIELREKEYLTEPELPEGVTVNDLKDYWALRIDTWNTKVLTNPVVPLPLKDEHPQLKLVSA